MAGEFSRLSDTVLSPLYVYEVFFLVIFCAAIGLFAMNRLIIKMVGD